MSDPESFVLAFMRRLDEKIDRMAEDVRELKGRMTSVEEHFAKLELSISGVNRRIDRVEERLERIERRLDLVEVPH